METENLKPFFTDNEKKLFVDKYRQLLHDLSSYLKPDDISNMKELMTRVIKLNCYTRDKNGINGLLRNIETALIGTEEIGPWKVFHYCNAVLSTYSKKDNHHRRS